MTQRKFVHDDGIVELSTCENGVNVELTFTRSVPFFLAVGKAQMVANAVNRMLPIADAKWHIAMQMFSPAPRERNPVSKIPSLGFHKVACFKNQTLVRDKSLSIAHTNLKPKTRAHGEKKLLNMISQVHNVHLRLISANR